MVILEWYVYLILQLARLPERFHFFLMFFFTSQLEKQIDGPYSTGMIRDPLNPQCVWISVANDTLIMLDIRAKTQQRKILKAGGWHEYHFQSVSPNNR